jgi:hypothetical protein
MWAVAPKEKNYGLNGRRRILSFAEEVRDL